MTYWNGINIDIQMSLMTNIDTGNEEINKMINAFTDFDFIYCIRDINNDDYNRTIISLYNKLYLLRDYISLHLIKKSKMMLLRNINIDQQILSLVDNNLELPSIAFDELITFDGTTTYNYSFQNSNSINITINNTITTPNHDFDLLRLKLLFNTIDPIKKRLYKAELIDLSVFKNEHAIEYFENKFVKIQYNSVISGQIKLSELVIPSIKYVIQDLYLILFINSTIAWDDNKYEKRLTRLIISLAINLTEEVDANIFDENINYFILFIILVKYIRKKIAFDDGIRDGSYNAKYQEMEKQLNILILSVLSQEQFTHFLNMELGQFNNIRPSNDVYLKQLYNQGNIYDFMCKIILLYFYKFMRDTPEEYNEWRERNTYDADLIQFKNFIETLNKVINIAYINFIPMDIRRIINDKVTQITIKQSEYHLLGGQVDIMMPYQQQFIHDNIFKNLKNKTIFSDAKLLITQISNSLKKINQFCKKYYDEKELYIINDKIIYQPYIKDEYIDKIIFEQNKLFDIL